MKQIPIDDMSLAEQANNAAKAAMDAIAMQADLLGYKGFDMMETRMRFIDMTIASLELGIAFAKGMSGFAGLIQAMSHAHLVEIYCPRCGGYWHDPDNNVSGEELCGKCKKEVQVRTEEARPLCSHSRRDDAGNCITCGEKR